MYLFTTRPFWREMGIPYNKIESRFKVFFGKQEKEITDRQESIDILTNITSSIQKKMLTRIKNESTYGIFFKLYYIFNEVHSIYLKEKEVRSNLVKQNIDEKEITQTLNKNRNIERDIIDASNIWIENSILYQQDLDIQKVNVDKEFVMDYDLIIDLYLYGFASRGISLLTLSKSIAENNSYYGLKITGDKDIPADILEYHPYVYYNTTLSGNQNILGDVPLTKESNGTEFGKGFKSEHGVEFLLFLTSIMQYQNKLLNDNDKSLTVIKKEKFINLVENYTKPHIDGKAFYNSFVLTKNKVSEHLRKNEKLIWIVGTNKYRHELRPFIGLDDGNVLISYGALEQAKQLWVSYFKNGGMCYTNPATKGPLTKAMELRNNELSDILVDKIRGVLDKHYTSTIDLKDVKYKRIFGKTSINYGDYDIVYYCKDKKELFLIESKYFSDSLNSSGMVTDYKKMFKQNGYYKHCRNRYDLVLSEPEKVKKFINESDEISVHMLFISSKPIEMELEDKDGVVTMLSLSMFENYLEDKLINNDNYSVRSPKKI